jgi:hypothetical protein
MTDLKPQFLNELVISMDVPSASAGPHSTCSGAAAPSLGVSSSSSSGVLRVLKNMFAWCCDTRQCQDVLLSNQRHQNKKMGIDEFPLLVTPLDDDPFATLSAADIAAMEAAPTPTRLSAASTRTRRRAMTRMMMSDPLLRLELLLFSLFGVLMPKGEKNLSIYVVYRFYSDLACKTIIMYVLVVWTWFLKNICGVCM